MVFIKIYYGPYEAHGVIKHRIQRMRGLMKYLSNMNYDIEIAPVNFLNRLSIEMCHRQIFQCDIRNLKFNLDYEDDIVCQRAVEAVIEASSRMFVDENVPKYVTVGEGKRYIAKLQQGVETRELLSETDLLFEIPKQWSEMRDTLVSNKRTL